MPTLAVGMFCNAHKHAHGKRGHGTHSFNGRTVLVSWPEIGYGEFRTQDYIEIEHFMFGKPPDGRSRHPTYLLRRADQAAVAVLMLLGLAAAVGWWISQGGPQGRLIEVDRAEPQTAGFQVDLNEAEWPELVQLPGIGETLARRIVESRRTDGPFPDHEELKRVRGIGPKTLDRIRPYLRPIPGGGDLAGNP